MNAQVRVASNRDRDDIRDVYLQAFAEGESQLIAELAGNLLSEASDPATISLVAQMDGEVVGHVAFSPVFARSDSGLLGYILAPLAVRPRHHKTGIGSKLVKSGMARVWAMGANLLLVYGDPNYYGRFGFDAQAAIKFVPPYELQYPFGWLAICRRGPIGGHAQPVQLSCVASLRNPALW